MSLDVSLHSPESTWVVCPHCDGEGGHEEAESYYDGNITHNLNKMAVAAGIYTALWRPEEAGWKTAVDIIPSLKTGLDSLRAHPEKYQAFNPPNGWGSYEIFVPWVEGYLAACEAHPEAVIEVSR